MLAATAAAESRTIRLLRDDTATNPSLASDVKCFGIALKFKFAIKKKTD